MKTPNSKDGNDFSCLKQENQLKKMKLSLEFGASFSSEVGNKELDPRIESLFLDNIEKYEREYKKVKAVCLFEFIGKPEFRKSDTIPDQEIHKELDHIIDILNQNQISLDTLCNVNDREIYRFITDELFLEEMDNMRTPGMTHHYIYEEFHPNHEYDITNNCIGFFKSFFKKKIDYYTSYLTKEATINRWFEDFRNAYNSLKLRKIEIRNLKWDKHTATVDYNLSFSAKSEGSNEKTNFIGSGVVALLHDYDYWSINNISMALQKQSD